MDTEDEMHRRGCKYNEDFKHDIYRFISKVSLYIWIRARVGDSKWNWMKTCIDEFDKGLSEEFGQTF